MTGSRLRFVLHDGKRVVDDRTISRKFHGMKVPDATKILYDTKTKEYESGELAGKEEITSINGIKKKGKDGFQVYLALMKGGEVLKMGLSADPKDNEKFLNAADLMIDMDKLESHLEHLPDDVELAVVWRYDKAMTQDIILTENSMVSRIAPDESPNGFSLLDKQPPVGCGGGFGGDAETVYDLTEVLIYTGEQDNPIRMSNIVMAAPPEVSCWDSSDSFQHVQPIVQPDGVPNRKAIENATDSSMRMCWQDEIKSSGVSIEPINFHCFYDAPAVSNEASPAASQAVILLVCDDSPGHHMPKAREYKPDDNPIIRLLMNPTERKLWGKLYGLPDDEIQELPIQQTRKAEKTMTVRMPKPMVLGFKRLKMQKQAAMPRPTEPKARQEQNPRIPKPPPLPRPVIPRDRTPKQKHHVPTNSPVPIEYKAPKSRPAKACPRRTTAYPVEMPVQKAKVKQKTKAPKARRREKQGKLEKPVETRRKLQRHEPELKPKAKSTKPKLPKTMKQKTQKKQAKTLAMKPKASKKPKPSLKSKKSPKKKPRKAMHSYFRNSMLGLSARKKASGRARAGSSL